MPLNYTALRTEIETDPTAIGYAPLVTAGNDAGVADLLNQVRAGVAVEKSSIPMEDVLASVVLTEFNALSTAGKTACDLFLRGTRLKVNATTKATLGALFAAGTTTRTNLQALSSRDGSRAEFLFGENIVVTHSDVAHALRGI